MNGGSIPTSRAEVIGIIKKTNDHWQANHPDHQNAFWNRAAYHTGNMAAFKATGIEAYRAYSEAWAERNQWKGAKSDDRRKWKYTYGESDDFVLFGDWQACFQVYIDLYQLDPDLEKIARAREVMEYQMSTRPDDYLWWADGLYMVMPVMTKLHKVTGDPEYLKKLHAYFTYARNLMHDPATGLFFRDAKYLYPKHKSANGLKDFWARGNGWIFAAIPKVLEDLPADDPHRQEYVRIYVGMAKALAGTQQADGYWTRSILDPAHAPGPETSGTAFFTYGYLWGINQGLLDKTTYLPVVGKSWRYLTGTALQQDGAVGFVQPIGEKAIPGQVVDASSTADFGVGAFLLAASEMVTFIDKNPVSE
ncbi:MAG: glycoside hydrolase family 88 protein [Verrucomicrobiota bacterium]